MKEIPTFISIQLYIKRRGAGNKQGRLVQSETVSYADKLLFVRQNCRPCFCNGTRTQNLLFMMYNNLTIAGFPKTISLATKPRFNAISIRSLYRKARLSRKITALGKSLKGIQISAIKTFISKRFIESS